MYQPLNNSPKRQGVMVHEYVKKVAQSIAGEYYEKAASNDDFYKAWPKQDAYIRRCWQDHVGVARACLTEMLKSAKYTAEQKEQIYDALLLDRTLPKSQTRGIH